MSSGKPIADAAERAAAIDPGRSFIVQAPAGSGKTELLIQRHLALLGRVEDPKRILAITFTRKAAGEMRSRLLEALAAAEQAPPEQQHRRLTWNLARAALEQDRRLGWDLLQNPSCLAIQTIDSYNAALVRKMPWLTRMGGLPELADHPERLYDKAVEKLLGRLGSDYPGSEELAQLLAHLDNRMERLQQMLVDMLGRRDQWLRHLLGIGRGNPRQLLEQGLVQLVESRLAALSDLLPRRYHQELLFCGRYAAEQLHEGEGRAFSALYDLEEMPAAIADQLPAWKGIANLLLTAKGELRKPKGVNARCGFPAGAEGKPAKERMQQLLIDLEEIPAFAVQLAQVSDLPVARYGRDQWRILDALVALLPILVGELWMVFRGEGKTDFAEIALKAKSALGGEEDPSDLLLKLDASLEHILIDEFQDTSWLQYELLQTLTSGWQRGDGRTLFLVGDPMQSIYRFREAEVGLFLRTYQGRLGVDGPLLEPLRLRCNFRSQAGIVDWINSSFAAVFPAEVDEASGAVPLAEAVAVHSAEANRACLLHPQVGRDDAAEAESVLEIVEQARREDPQQTVAILVRGRTHLPEILRALRQKGVSYQAQDIDLLGERPAALDLLALTRALLHRADRLSWLAVLRAPWCGLSLADLHALVDGEVQATIPSLLADDKRRALLGSDGQQRLGRVWPLLEQALQQRGRVTLREMVEGCWLALGGPACYRREGGEDAMLVLGLIESLQQGGELNSLEQLEEGMAKLFAAPDSEADGTLQVMTIHKAKGLEFDTVIIPGLGRQPRGGDTTLLRWLEHPDFGLLLAPIAARDGSDQDPIYKLIGSLEQQKQDLETARLLYVAATRPKRRLHLLGHAVENARGELKPPRGSLLETLWDVVAGEFCEHAAPAVGGGEQYRHLPLKRLPLGWNAPGLLSAPLPEQSGTGKPSDSGRAEDDLIFSGWETQSRRHIGTLVHNLLERHAGRQESAIDDRQRHGIGRQLSALGVPGSELEAAVGRVEEAVQRTLESDRGRWILKDRPFAECELALSGLVGGKLVHAVIDRTFVDDDGVCWVIDYKTSVPKSGESPDAFMAREAQHYRRQLASYAELMRNMKQGGQVRAALYFPLLDLWCPVEVKGRGARCEVRGEG